MYHLLSVLEPQFLMSAEQGVFSHLWRTIYKSLAHIPQECETSWLKCERQEEQPGELKASQTPLDPWYKDGTNHPRKCFQTYKRQEDDESLTWIYEGKILRKQSDNLAWNYWSSGWRESNRYSSCQLARFSSTSAITSSMTNGKNTD